MRRLLVLGATSAIGEAIVRRLLPRLEHVHLVARDAGRLDLVAQNLRLVGDVRVTTEVADLDEIDRHAAIVAAADEALGGMDGVLLTYGVLGDQAAGERDFAAAQRSLTTNFVGAASLLTHAANRMEPRRAGRIVVVGSVAGDRGRATNYVYGSAKAGLHAFAQGLRNRLHGSGVRVLTVKPGFVATPMTAHLRQGALFSSPDRVARGVVRAIRRNREVVYVPGYWRLVMLPVRFLPERFFKRLRL